MLSYFIRRVHQKQAFILSRPTIVIGVPSGITNVESKGCQDAAKKFWRGGSLYSGRTDGGRYRREVAGA